MAVQNTFDIAIVGGGLVGASLACALAPLGYRIVVLEKVSPKTASQPSYDDRTLALSHSSCRILEGLGLWSELEPHATAITEIIASEPGRPGRVVLKPSELGLTAFGNVVEARSFGAVVMDTIAHLDNVELKCPATVCDLEVRDDSVILSLAEEDRTIETRLLVAADGAASMIREMLDIGAKEHDYGQSAVICNVTPQQHHRGRAFERLTPSGPFAILPHAGSRCGLVWSVASGDAPGLMEMAESEFLVAAHERFGNDLGPFLKMGKRSCYPLKLVRANKDIHQRCVIIGNAAHTIHPVGAQGFNLGLRDVAVLAEILAKDSAADPGSMSLLAEYSQWRQSDQDDTVTWSDGMTRLFANPSPILSAFRSAGMIAHALLPGLRRRMAINAMGYRGRIPKLAMGESIAPDSIKGTHS
jgi:2-octaprenyl-6-methoxyphenol hydroxylase